MILTSFLLAIFFLFCFVFSFSLIFVGVNKKDYDSEFWYGCFISTITFVGLAGVFYLIHDEAKCNTMKAAYYYGVSYEIKQETKINESGNIEIIKQDTIFNIKK